MPVATFIKIISWLLLLWTMFYFCGCVHPTEPISADSSSSKEDPRALELLAAMAAVKPFFSPLPAPGPADWLSSFHESGQTFTEYLNSNPTIPTDQRKTIYVLPLGKFTEKQKQVIAITSAYLEAFYGLSVKGLPEQLIKRPLKIKDSRTNAISKKEQVRTGYILDDVLKPMLPSDGAALIAFTNEDLFPDSTMNYVFGQASLENRVGVWSPRRQHRLQNLSFANDQDRCA